MPGTFILKPLEANIRPDPDLKAIPHNIDAYCKVKIGDQKFMTHPSKKIGTHPSWNEELVIQQGDQHCGKLVLKDKNSEKKIGKVRFNLEDVREKGKVTKWFDIYKHNHIQGQILMDMVYTSANPRSKSFHQAAKVGAALPASRGNWHDLDRFQRHSEAESTKFMLANGMSNPNTVMLGVNENIGHTGHDDFHHHNNIEREKLGPNGEIDLKYTNDATLRDLHLTENPADTGMSNPNTAKLGINHGNGPYGVTNPYNENYVVEKKAKFAGPNRDPTLKDLKPTNNTANTGMSNPNTAKLGVNHRGHNQQQHAPRMPDPTLKDMHMTGNPADTGMSNPNTAKLGINHKEGPVSVTNPKNKNYAAPKQAAHKENASKAISRSPAQVSHLSDVNLGEDAPHDRSSDPNTLGLGDESLKGLRKYSDNIPQRRYIVDPYDVGTHSNYGEAHHAHEHHSHLHQKVPTYDNVGTHSDYRKGPYHALSHGHTHGKPVPTYEEVGTHSDYRKGPYHALSHGHTHGQDVPDYPEVGTHSDYRRGPYHALSHGHTSGQQDVPTYNEVGTHSDYRKGPYHALSHGHTDGQPAPAYPEVGTHSNYRKGSYHVPSHNKHDAFHDDAGTHSNYRRPHGRSEDLGTGGTEMSNPNNAKFGVNRNIGHTGPTNFHENVATNEGLGPQGTRSEHDHPNPNLITRPSYSGASNPNNIGTRRYY